MFLASQGLLKDSFSRTFVFENNKIYPNNTSNLELLSDDYNLDRALAYLHFNMWIVKSSVDNNFMYRKLAKTLDICYSVYRW